MSNPILTTLLERWHRRVPANCILRLLAEERELAIEQVRDTVITPQHKWLGSIVLSGDQLIVDVRSGRQFSQFELADPDCIARLEARLIQLQLLVHHEPG